MMTRNKSTRKNLIKYALMLPVLLLLVLVFTQNDLNSIETNNIDFLYAPDTKIEDVVQIETAIQNENIPTIIASQNGEAKIPIRVVTNLNFNAIDTSRVYKVVQQMPRFPGCEQEQDPKKCATEKMLRFIYTNIKYPADARKANVEGTTVIRFIVAKSGQVKDAKIVRDIGGGCGKESLRIVNMMPDFIPGKENGENVDVQFNLPIKFKLQGDKKPVQEEKETQSSSIELGNTPIIMGAGNPDLKKTVDEMPRFPGCEEEANNKEECSQQKLLEFIFKQVRYPNQAKLERVQGVTVIKFVVDENGKIVNPEIVKNIGGGCGEESLRVVKSMPDWIPGRDNGKAVAVEYNLPIKYALPKKGIEHAIETDQTMSDEEASNISDKLSNRTVITPRFPGCESITGDKSQCANQKMYAFIYDNIVYPNGIKRESINGEIRVRFTIDQLGTVGNVEISNGISKELDKEVLRVINSMPNWIPGVASEEVLSVTISIPIAFSDSSSNLNKSQKAFIDGKIHPSVKERLKDAYGDTYGNDVSHNKGFTKEDQDHYILRLKAIEMTMKEYDPNAILKVGTGEGESKTSEEWLRHFEKAIGELMKFSSTDQEFKQLLERVGQNQIRILHGQK